MLEARGRRDIRAARSINLHLATWTQNTVPVGTVLSVEGYHAIDGTNKAVGRDFTLPDGSRLFLGGSAPSTEGNGQ